MARETTSRDRILESLRSATLPDTPRPARQFAPIQYDDVQAAFLSSLKAVGGTGLAAKDDSDFLEQLQSLPAFQNAQHIASCIPGIADADVDLKSVCDPHDLEQLDLLIARGEFGVAENGAIWVTGSQVSHRAAYFICQHLILVVAAGQLVHNMHDAYERLTFKEPGFGLFLSGPSKTADIEQSLVMGAHGARSLTVFLLGVEA